MPDDNWDRVEEIFLDAVELPEDQRQVYLEIVCLGDPALLAEVESLLRADALGEAPLATAIESEAARCWRIRGPALPKSR